MSDDRHWTAEELATALHNRGCVSTYQPSGRGIIWLKPNGDTMTVPPPPDSRGYPPRLVRDILFFADIGNRPDFPYH